MRVLITGATGLIGSAVTRELLARDDDVIGLTRDPAGATAARPEVTWHGWDAAHEQPPAAALAGVDAVVNLVGETIAQRWTGAAKERIRRSRIAATQNLVKAIAAAAEPPRVMISQSAVGFYGDGGAAIIDESHGPGASFDAQLCADWEAAAREAGQSEVRLVVLRTGLVLDRSSGLLKELLLPFKLGLGGPLAGGNQYMPWIHLDDEVGLILWAIDQADVDGTLNATAPNPVTNRDFAKALGRVLSRPAVLPTPKLALQLRYGCEMADTASGGSRAVPSRAEGLGYEFKYTDVEEALRAAMAGGA